MLRPFAATVFSIFLLSAPEQASASFRSGNELYEQCATLRSDPAYYQLEAYCVGYIVGAYDMMELAQQIRGVPPCVRAGTTVQQLREIVVRYLERNPQNRDLAASALVAVALGEAYGCRMENPISR